MSLREGQQVSYVGMPTPEYGIGDRGTVLSLTASCAHVMWATGARDGQVDLMDLEDLTGHGPGRVAGSVFDDSLSTAGMVTFAVRETYDAGGPNGLLNAMNDNGHLASLEAIADAAIAHVASQVRSDPAFQSVLAHLDESEAAEFVTVTAVAVLRDAFGGAE